MKVRCIYVDILYNNMFNIEDVFKKFCEALPETLELNYEQKKQAFDFLFKIAYQYLMRNPWE